jgi:hypothetical protein
MPEPQAEGRQILNSPMASASFGKCLDAVFGVEGAREPRLDQAQDRPPGCRVTKCYGVRPSSAGSCSEVGRCRLLRTQRPGVRGKRGRKLVLEWAGHAPLPRLSGVPLNSAHAVR